ncbi:Calmodulin-binding protein 60 C [Linum perenne]
MHTRYMERTNSMARGKRSSDGGDEDQQPDRKRPALASVIVEALKVDSLQKLCSSLEPILRRVVSEEVERALAKLGPPRINGRASPKRIEGLGGRKLQLQFRSQLSLPLFTGGKVEGEQGAAIHVVLLDAKTGHVVTSGPEASAKLDVIVLEGDFNNEDEEDWTEEDFESHVVKEREGKRPLLTGELQVVLKEGVYVDTLVKKAYENWNEVVEYDGKSLLSFKQTKRSTTSRTEGQIGHPNAFDPQTKIQGLSAADLNDKSAVHTATGVPGLIDNMEMRYSSQSQVTQGNPHSQFEGMSYPPHEPLLGSSHRSENTRGESSPVGLSLLHHPPQAAGLPTLGSPFQQPSLTPFDDWSNNNNNRDRVVDEFLTEEDIRMRSNEMLENEDMQHLLRLFSMGGHPSMNVPEDGFTFPYMASPMPNYEVDRMRPPGKAVVGWLKIKAAMRWGFFIRKKAAERRAQLVELDDEEEEEE